MKIEIIPLVISLIPATLITILAIYFFKLHTSNEERRRRFLLHRENQKQSFPLKLQAYERMVLFLERISPSNLLLRTAPLNDDKRGYESLLIHTIDQEFEHNMAQQIYISDDCWNTIKAAKNATIGLVRKASLKEDIDSSDKMRELIITTIVEKGSPSDTAIAFIKNEINEFL